MNEASGTRAALLEAARELFARHGYDGASVRAITGRAGTNLGAITYHFGTKQELYERVLQSLTDPLVQHLHKAAARTARPLDAILALVRAFFEHLIQNPQLPTLMLHDLSLGRPAPPPVRRAMQEVAHLLTRLIEAGQQEGRIVPGPPTLLVVSIVAQPIFINLVRQRLRLVFGLDTGDPATRQQIVDHVVQFVHRGLAPSRRKA